MISMTQAISKGYGGVAEIRKKRGMFASQNSQKVSEALEVIPPSVAYSSSSVVGAGAVAVDLLGGPEETLG